MLACSPTPYLTWKWNPLANRSLPRGGRAVHPRVVCELPGREKATSLPGCRATPLQGDSETEVEPWPVKLSGLSGAVRHCQGDCQYCKVCVLPVNEANEAKLGALTPLPGAESVIKRQELSTRFQRTFGVRGDNTYFSRNTRSAITSTKTILIALTQPLFMKPMSCSCHVGIKTRLP